MIATAVVAVLTVILASVAMRVVYGGAPWAAPQRDVRPIEGDTLDEMWRKMAVQAAQPGAAAHRGSTGTCTQSSGRRGAEEA